MRGRHVRGRVLAAVAVIAAVLASGCGDGGPTAPPEELEGGVLATFRVQSETFRVWTDRPAAIEDLMALEDGESSATIPNAPLRRGPGRGDHNEPWSWHMDPDGLELAGATAEYCDGRPSFVESELDRWMDEVGRYCPWSAELVRLRDFR